MAGENIKRLAELRQAKHEVKAAQQKLRALTNGRDPDPEPAAAPEQDWDEPIDLLRQELEKVPAFPSDFLPGSLQAFAVDTITRMQCRVDLIGIPLIISAGSMIGKFFGIGLKAKDDWRERPCLWGGIIHDVGMLKSPAFNAALGPLLRCQLKLKESHQAAVLDYEAKCRAAGFEQSKWDEACKEAIKSRAAKMPERPAECDPPSRPLERRLFSSDFSQEKLVQLLEQNPRGLLAYRDELSGWFNSFNQYRDGADRQFYLTCHSGGAWPQDRISGNVWITDLFLSVFGGFQPGVISRVLTGDEPDGMTARFSLLVWPDVPDGFDYTDRPPDRDARQQVDAVFEKLGTFEPEAFFGPEDPKTNPDYLRMFRLDADAQPIFKQWYIEHMKTMRSGKLEEPLRAHFSKYPGLFGRLSVVHHLLCHAVGKTNSPGLAANTTAIAVRNFIDAYLKPHAERIYRQLARSSAYNGARRIAAWLAAHPNVSVFTARDIRRKEWAGLTDQADVNKALDYLEHVARWISSEDVSFGKGSTGGRATTRYLVNPKIRPR